MRSAHRREQRAVRQKVHRNHRHARRPANAGRRRFRVELRQIARIAGGFGALRTVRVVVLGEGGVCGGQTGLDLLVTNSEKQSTCCLKGEMELAGSDEAKSIVARLPKRIRFSEVLWCSWRQGDNGRVF